ncbi:hypothetical protein ACR56S_04205 [Staphylococcus hominis]|uniref:hypothetical protein n=1 Tax=Staphylococcus hominis TaxID=1290 RepID=UPI003DA0CC3D
MSEVLKDIRTYYPDHYALFNQPITEKELNEIAGKEITEHIVREQLIDDGYPRNIDLKDINYEIRVTNHIDAYEYAEMYLMDVIDLDNDYFYRDEEERKVILASIIQKHFTKHKIDKYRIERGELNFEIIAHDDVQAFLDKHSWLDILYMAKKLADLVDITHIKTLIERREIYHMNGREVFTHIFRQSTVDYLQRHDLDEDLVDIDLDRTPVKALNVKFALDFERMADLLRDAPKNFKDIYHYVSDDGFYKDLISHGLITYDIELDVDPIEIKKEL